MPDLPLTPEQSQLVQRHRPLVARNVDTLPASSQRVLPREELLALGNLGLVEAARNYDPHRGAEFETYAWIRIRGTIMNAVDKELQSVRDCLRAARAAGDAFLEDVKSEGNFLTDTEADIRGRFDRLRDGYYASMFAAFTSAASREASEGIEESHARREMKARALGALGTATSALPERDQQLVNLCYRDGNDLKRVAGELRVSYATVRRMHQRVMQGLGAELRKLGVTAALSP